MKQFNVQAVFTKENLSKIFPESRTDQFFEALFGDASEGAYDICLEFKKANEDKLWFEFQLKQRPGKCLACNLTYGLPDVLSRHPVIDLKGVIEKIDRLLGDRFKCLDWELGHTIEISRALHVIPLTIRVTDTP